MSPKTEPIKDEAPPLIWPSLPEPRQQQVVAQLVKLLIRQIGQPLSKRSREVSDEPASQDQC